MSKTTEKRKGSKVAHLAEFMERLLLQTLVQYNDSPIVAIDIVRVRFEERNDTKNDRSNLRQRWYRTFALQIRKQNCIHT